MEYGAIDLHKKESQIRIVTEGGEMVDRRIATTRERLTARVRGTAPDADSARGVDGERVGRAAPRDPRPRGDRGGSDVRADVQRAQPTHQDRSARCRRVGGGVSAGLLSRGASAIGVAAHGAGAAQCPSRTDGQSDAGDLAGAGDHARRRASDSEWQYRELPRPGGGAGSPLVDDRDARAVAARDRGPERRSSPRRMTSCRRIAAEDPVVARLTTRAGHRAHHRDARMSPRWMTPRASVARRRWRAIWASCPASTARANSSDGARDAQCPSLCPILAGPGRVARVARQRIPGRPVFAAGPRALRTDAGRTLRWSPWPAASRASCSRCGETGCRMTRPARDRRDAHGDAAITATAAAPSAGPS